MQYNNLEIIDKLWYGKLGIIKANDTLTNEIKIYIGEGWGFDEKQDIEHIIDFGTKYSIAGFRTLINWLEVDNG